MPRQLTNLRIEEVSSVDRGAGKGVRVLLTKRHAAPNADDPYTSLEKGDLTDDVFAYLKREFSSEQRESMAGRGTAMPHGGFPIANKEDLKNAIQAIGRAKDRAATIAHIRRRARALGATDMLPDSWSKRDPETITKALTAAIETMRLSPTENLVRLFKSYHEYLTQETEMPVDISKEDLVSLIGQAVTKAVDAEMAKWAKKKPPAGDDDADDVGKEVASGHSRRAEGDAPPETGDTDSAESKDAPPPKRAKKGVAGDRDAGSEHEKPNPFGKRFEEELAKRDVENATLKKQLAVLVEKDQRAEFTKRAESLGLTGREHGDMLLKVHRGDPKAIEAMEGIIKGLTAQVATSDLFKTFGFEGGGAPITAYDELVAKGEELRKADNKLTAAQAFTKAIEMYPEIAKREVQERHNRIQKFAN